MPTGNFEAISVLLSGWESQFESLVTNKRPIRYDMYPLTHIPEKFQSRLKAGGYSDLVLENDRWQHFLIPGLC